MQTLEQACSTMALLGGMPDLQVKAETSACLLFCQSTVHVLAHSRAAALHVQLRMSRKVAQLTKVSASLWHSCAS